MNRPLVFVRFVMTPSASQSPFFCKLFPDPGVRRVLAWGDWKDSLKGLLKHPERLRDNHRLPCLVQVVEAHAQSRSESLSRMMFQGESAPPALIEFTSERSQRLGLTDDLKSRPPDRNSRRLCFLRIESDPTVDVPERMPAQPAAAAPIAPPATPAREAKRAIPDECIRGINFPISRDEALYDMQQVSRIESWRDLFGQRAAFEKWQRLLWGKNLEEQLWTVRPPKKMLRDPRVRAWAEKTLEAAGYDKTVMLTEWEIYWRRLGR